MFKLMGKEINATLGAQTILIWTYAVYYQDVVYYNLILFTKELSSFDKSFSKVKNKQEKKQQKM